MSSFRFIDTTGLPAKFDIADLVESGVQGKNLAEWCAERVKPGKPQLLDGDRGKIQTSAARAAKTVKPPETVVQGNVVTLPQPVIIPGTPIEYSQDSIAAKFSDKYHEELVYVGARNSWFHWTGSIWEKDETHYAFDKARGVCREFAREAFANEALGRKASAIAANISSRPFISSIEAIARSDRRHVARPADFDADPWILNTPEGVVDLKTGEIRAARKSDLCSKITTAGPGSGGCPMWLSFLEDATAGDPELIDYLQRIMGYALTGSIAEQKFFFLYGQGGNGKGVFLNLLHWIMGDYARAAKMETFTEQKFRGHSSEIAYFQGARLVTAQETDSGNKWDESRIKSMTGGDPLTANHMRENPFTFYPVFKLIFAGNHKPQLRHVDDAIKRRLYMIPFDFSVPEEAIDKHLDKKLQAEAAGIMAWAIEGCLKWQRDGLRAPDRVKAITTEYFATEDKIGSFIEECCDLGAYQTSTTAVYAIFQLWAKESGEQGASRKIFNEMIATKGFASEKRGGRMVIEGLRVNQDYMDRLEDPGRY